MVWDDVCTKPVKFINTSCVLFSPKILTPVWSPERIINPINRLAWCSRLCGVQSSFCKQWCKLRQGCMAVEIYWFTISKVKKTPLFDLKPQITNFTHHTEQLLSLTWLNATFFRPHYNLERWFCHLCCLCLTSLEMLVVKQFCCFLARKGNHTFNCSGLC